MAAPAKRIEISTEDRGALERIVRSRKAERRMVERAVGDQHVVAVQHATAEHGGKRLDITACQLMTIEDGRIVDIRGHYSDQYALDDFWS